MQTAIQVMAMLQFLAMIFYVQIMHKVYLSVNLPKKKNMEKLKKRERVGPSFGAEKFKMNDHLSTGLKECGHPRANPILPPLNY